MLKKPHTHICAVPVWKWGHISADSYSTCQVLCFIWSCNYRISVIFSQTLPFKAFQWEYLHVNTAFCPGFAFSFTCLSLFQLSVQLQGVRYFSLFFFLFAGRHYVLRTVGVGVRGVWCRGGQVIVVQAERETRLALNTPNYISINLQRWRLIWQWPICSSGCISGSYPGRWQDGD